MIITKQGDIEEAQKDRDFVCAVCGCEFTATHNEYKYLDSEEGTIFWCTCPTCRHNIPNNPIIADMELRIAALEFIANELTTTRGVNYTTIEPTADNTEGDLKIVILDAEPTNRYEGYQYYITE